MSEQQSNILPFGIDPNAVDNLLGAVDNEPRTVNVRFTDLPGGRIQWELIVDPPLSEGKAHTSLALQIGQQVAQGITDSLKLPEHSDNGSN